MILDITHTYKRVYACTHFHSKKNLCQNRFPLRRPGESFPSRSPGHTMSAVATLTLPQPPPLVLPLGSPSTLPSSCTLPEVLAVWPSGCLLMEALQLAQNLHKPSFLQIYPLLAHPRPSDWKVGRRAQHGTAPNGCYVIQ